MSTIATLINYSALRNASNCL